MNVYKISGIIVLIFISVASWAEELTFTSQFDKVELKIIAKAVGKLLDKLIILDESVKENTVLSFRATEVDKAHYYRAFVSLLQEYNLSVKEISEEVIKITNKAPLQKNIGTPTQTMSDLQVAVANNDALATHTFFLKNLMASSLTAELKKLLDQDKELCIHHNASSNSLIITGAPQKIVNLGQLIAILEEHSTKGLSLLKIQYANVVELVSTLEKLVQLKKDLYQSVSVIPEVTTNTLCIFGPVERRTLLLNIAKKLDLPIDKENSIFYLKYANAKLLAEALNTLIKKRANPISVVPVGSINALILDGPKSELVDLRKVINELDLHRAQVHVQAIICEITENQNDTLGLQWQLNPHSLIQIPNASEVGVSVFSNMLRSSDKPDANLMQLISNYKGSAFGVVKKNWVALLQALETHSKTNILSTPSIIALDNQEASFTVGEDVPILTGTTSDAVKNKKPFQTIERRSIGTKLTILPQINEGNTIQLKVTLEVSKVKGSTGLDITFSERKLNTTLLAENGQLIILGGLIDDQKEVIYTKIPLLSTIPILGKLFQSKAKHDQKRNLIIFLCPTIMRDNISSHSITQKKYKHFLLEDLYENYHKLEQRVPFANEGTPYSNELKLFRSM